MIYRLAVEQYQRQSSVFLSFLLLSRSLAELSSPCQRILRCSHTIWVSISLPWLGDLMHSNCILDSVANRLVHHMVFVRKVQKSGDFCISSQGLVSFSLFLLSRSSSHRKIDKMIVHISSTLEASKIPAYNLQSRKSCCCLGYPGKNLGLWSFVRDDCPKQARPHCAQVI